MSGNDFWTLGIGNGKLPSQFPNFWIGNGKNKYDSQLLGLGMGMNKQIPNVWDWEWEWKLKSQHLVMAICISFPKKVGNTTGISKMPLPCQALCWACLAAQIYVCISVWINYPYL